MHYPKTRLRRARQADWSRRLSGEVKLTADDLVWPLFVSERDEDAGPVASLPGVTRYRLDEVAAEVKKAYELGIPAVALFPNVDPAKKCLQGKEALNPDNLVCRAIQAIKAGVPQVGVIADVALDPYTSHGQDGLVEDGVILNDETVAVLSEQALILAEAGADVVAPSDMMDGRIAAIRHTLEAAGKIDTIILSYAAKYASCLYGPFRDAVGSSAALGAADKRTYQMNPANAAEALLEAQMDLDEGADWLMVKPGMLYLDILKDVATLGVPTFAYQVSGEYAMLKQYGDASVIEALLAFKRAGAAGIFTYAAREVAAQLKS
jgi:porphobilinogen synthase